LLEVSNHATRATAHIEIVTGRRSRWISYRHGVRVEGARYAPEASE
jgi:hypothetical protein